jgi:hypothetical protein
MHRYHIHLIFSFFFGIQIIHVRLYFQPRTMDGLKSALSQCSADAAAASPALSVLYNSVQQQLNNLQNATQAATDALQNALKLPTTTGLRQALQMASAAEPSPQLSALTESAIVQLADLRAQHSKAVTDLQQSLDKVCLNSVYLEPFQYLIISQNIHSRRLHPWQALLLLPKRPSPHPSSSSCLNKRLQLVNSAHSSSSKPKSDWKWR